MRMRRYLWEGCRGRKDGGALSLKRQKGEKGAEEGIKDADGTLSLGGLKRKKGGWGGLLAGRVLSLRWL